MGDTLVVGVIFGVVTAMLDGVDVTEEVCLKLCAGVDGINLSSSKSSGILTTFVMGLDLPVLTNRCFMICFNSRILELEGCLL